MFNGNELGTPTSLPTEAVSFDYDKNRINTLLARPEALGLRLHFDRPRTENPTALYAAACGFSRDILDPDTAAKNDFFKSDGTAVAAANLPEIALSTAQPKAGACVFFSQTLLGDFLQDAQVARLRFYVVPFGEPEEGFVPNLSLVVAGVDGAGQTLGRFTLSEQPCPPNCPMGDYL